MFLNPSPEETTAVSPVTGTTKIQPPHNQPRTHQVIDAETRRFFRWVHPFHQDLRHPCVCFLSSSLANLY